MDRSTLPYFGVISVKLKLLGALRLQTMQCAMRPRYAVWKLPTDYTSYAAWCINATSMQGTDPR